MRNTFVTMFLALFAFGIAGCATAPMPDPGVLRVGVTANHPPFCYTVGGRPAGLEVDFAKALGGELKREVKFVTLRPDAVIPAVENGKVDIAMAGLTVNPLRSLKVAFAVPYMKSGQMVLARNSDLARYRDVREFLWFSGRIGVESGTVGETLARRNYSRSIIKSYWNPQTALKDLDGRTIDAFIHDAPVILGLAAAAEATGLQAVRAPLTHERVAWALSRDDDDLLAAVNRVLADWAGDGQRDRMIEKWLPYYAKYGLNPEAPDADLETRGQAVAP